MELLAQRVPVGRRQRAFVEYNEADACALGAAGAQCRRITGEARPGRETGGRDSSRGFQWRERPAHGDT